MPGWSQAASGCGGHQCLFLPQGNAEQAPGLVPLRRRHFPGRLGSGVPDKGQTAVPGEYFVCGGMI